MTTHLRIARPVTDLETAAAMYQRGLGLERLGSFAEHDGFDGVMLGARGAHYHLELVYSRERKIVPTPTEEDLLVLYISSHADWATACDNMLAAGFRAVAPGNPYWARCGRTFVDADGYRIVLQNAAFTPAHVSTEA